MDEFGGGTLVAIAALFLVSGGLKLYRPTPARNALAVAGIPERLRRSVAATVAVLELVAALLLLARPGAASAGAAGVMLLGFSGFLILLEVRAPDLSCGCLGDLGSGSHRAGLARNVALLAGLALVVSGAPKLDWMAVALGVQLAVLLAVISEGVSVAAELRRTLHNRTASEGDLR